MTTFGLKLLLRCKILWEKVKHNFIIQINTLKTEQSDIEREIWLKSHDEVNYLPVPSLPTEEVKVLLQ